MKAESIEKVICPFGKIDFTIDTLRPYQTVGDSLLTARDGVCEGCKRNWIEKTEGAKKDAPLEVILKEEEGNPNVAVVYSCDNPFSD